MVILKTKSGRVIFRGSGECGLRLARKIKDLYNRYGQAVKLVLIDAQPVRAGLL